MFLCDYKKFTFSCCIKNTYLVFAFLAQNPKHTFLAYNFKYIHFCANKKVQGVYCVFPHEPLNACHLDRPDAGQVVDVLAFWRGRRCSNPESVKLTQVAIDSPPMQPCTVCRGAICGDGLRQLVTLSGTNTSMIKI